MNRAQNTKKKLKSCVLAKECATQNSFFPLLILLNASIVHVLIKSKVFPVHTIKAYGGSRDIAPFIFILGARWTYVDNFTLLPLYPR
jgi:hypothetical protein